MLKIVYNLHALYCITVLYQLQQRAKHFVHFIHFSLLIYIQNVHKSSGNLRKATNLIVKKYKFPAFVISLRTTSKKDDPSTVLLLHYNVKLIL